MCTRRERGAPPKSRPATETYDRVPRSSYGQYRSTPMHDAAQEGYVDVVRYLCEQGAEINRYDKVRQDLGSSPAHMRPSVPARPTGSSALLLRLL